MLSGGAKRFLIGASMVVLALQVQVPSADAGCGCNKPPPPPAAVRPSFASPGQTVTLFGSGIVAGPYRVTFKGDNGATAAVDADAVRQRDLADGVYKFQLSIAMPSGLPLGPTEIRVERANREVLRIARDAFTVLQAPLRLEQTDGVTLARCYQAAVDAAGTVYFPFDIGAIREHTAFSGIAEGYPLLFEAEDVTIYNAQGFLMQLLAPELAGTLYAIHDPGSGNSFELVYDRHEFVTYAAEHVHEANLALDRQDPRWHADGTPHVDHDHLVLAIAGRLEDGSLPSAGATPAFTFSVVTAVEGGSAPSTRTIQWSSACAAGSAD